MNLDPAVRRVLCFGDSNTYGIIPGERRRHPATDRWTGALQRALGSTWDVIEEGLPGRTTDLEDTVLGRAGRAGSTYFVPCLESLWPLDAIVLALGTNDLRLAYHRSPAEVATALEGYLDAADAVATAWRSVPATVILVNPPALDETAAGFEACMPAPGVYDASTARLSRQLAAPLASLARRRGTGFVDAAALGGVGVDGAHLEAAAHRALGVEVARALLR